MVNFPVIIVDAPKASPPDGPGPKSPGEPSTWNTARRWEHAALIADRPGQSAFVIGHGDEYAVISYKPKLLGGAAFMRCRQERAPMTDLTHSRGDRG